MVGCHVQPEQIFNLIFGYNDRYAESFGKTATGATEICLGTQVPAGEVWIVEAIAGANATRRATLIYLQVYDGTIHMPLNIAQPDATSLMLFWEGKITLKQTDRIRIVITGCVATDVLTAYAWGYKMKLTQ